MATPAPAPALPNVQLLCVSPRVTSLRYSTIRSYGPMLVGVFFNMMLYGVLVGQVHTYFQVYRKDALWMRLFVAYLFVMETVNTALDITIMYEPLILRYGEKPVFFPTVFMTEPLTLVLISAPIQVFFAWRMYTLIKNWWLPAIVCVLALGNFGGGIWLSTRVQMLRLFAKKPLLHNPALMMFSASCAADIIIAVTLVRTLSSKKTGFLATDTVVDKIIRVTIQTGMATAILAILDIATFMTLPHQAVNFVWDLALSKLYSNCLLSSLNARNQLNAQSHASTFQQLAIRSPQSNKQGFLDTTQGSAGTLTYDELRGRGRDAAYGIHMTKVCSTGSRARPFMWLTSHCRSSSTPPRTPISTGQRNERANLCLDPSIGFEDDLYLLSA
ncbi:hypothetical protein GGX14DRAFT_372671 [Mycena pura]|uniref:DUF6534 domain-containing protein n=1 Tax=Mycena pura TaxID=153505 RepID=A0AAD6Y706_9AGAR|nr:hypothetical protein GGX14DRAFT_372671 [Mycena pura]